MNSKIKEQETEILKLLHTKKVGMNLKRERWINKWREIKRFGFPYHGDGLTSEDDGEILDDEIINDYPSECCDTYVAGIQGATCSATAKFFNVEIDNPVEENSHAVDMYLDDINMIIRFWLGKTNFFEAKREQIAEMAIFGSGPMLIEEGDVFSSKTIELSKGDERPFYFIPLSCGSYYLGKNKNGDVDTLVREFTLDAKGMVEFFGEDVPDSIRDEAEKQSSTGVYAICQVIMPRRDFKLELPVNEDFTFLSFYYLDNVSSSSGIEISTAQGKTKCGLLRVSGYYEQPFAVPQEKPKISSAYSHSIGEYVRGNVKALQLLENDSYEVLEKIADPSMQGPVEREEDDIFTEAGAFNPYPMGVNSDIRYSPMYVPDNRAGEALEQKIQIVQERIYKRFGCDLFFAVTEKARNIKTAFEASLIDGERFTKLVPTIERLARTDAVILERVFSILQRNGWLIPAPDDLEGYDINFSFESPITQTLKLKKLTPLQQYIQVLGDIASFEAGSGKQPTATDLLNVDEASAEFADIMSVPSKVINDRKRVEQARQARAKKEEELKAEQMLQQLPEQAKALG